MMGELGSTSNEIGKSTGIVIARDCAMILGADFQDQCQAVPEGNGKALSGSDFRESAEM
jgi:hypothetical protein